MQDRRSRSDATTWTQPLARPYTGFIRFARSLDGGKTFSEPVTVHVDQREVTHRFDALSVNGHGQILVAWVDKGDGEAAKSKGKDYSGVALRFTVSDDGGASAKGDFKLADHSCECDWPRVRSLAKSVLGGLHHEYSIATASMSA